MIRDKEDAVGRMQDYIQSVSRQRRWDFQASKIRDIYAVADKASLAF